MKYDQPQAHDIHELLDKLVVVVEIVFIFNFFPVRFYLYQKQDSINKVCYDANLFLSCC